MSKLPRLRARQIIAALQRAGHHILKHADGRTTVIPVHAGETIGPGLLNKILQDCELTLEEFLAL